jgi:hypothetical protein
VNRRLEHNQFRTRIDGRFCIYCGERPNTDEHFPPVTQGLGGFILPACNECNRLAGTEWPRDFEERAGYVKRRLAKRYQATPPLTVDAILAEDENHWVDLIHEEKIRRRMEARLEWNAMAYLKTIAREEDLKGIDDLKRVEDPPAVAAAPSKPAHALTPKQSAKQHMSQLKLTAAEQGLVVGKSPRRYPTPPDYGPYSLYNIRTGYFLTRYKGGRLVTDWTVDDLETRLGGALRRPLTTEKVWERWLSEPDPVAEDEPERPAARTIGSSVTAP